MTVLHVSLALLTVVIGAFVGYSSAGIGGAILFGMIAGIGGLLVAELLAQTAGLIKPRWKALVVIAILLGLSAVTWGARL